MSNLEKVTFKFKVSPSLTFWLRMEGTGGHFECLVGPVSALLGPALDVPLLESSSFVS